MKERSSHRRGFTLVELLVVLAIVGFVVVLAIPMVGRLGLFGGSQQELAGRELFTLLRAAKIYATTYNVETALAYSVLTASDSETGQRIPYIDSVAIVRRLKPDEVRDRSIELAQVLRPSGLSGSPDQWFVPLRDREGHFKRFTGNTCILNDSRVADDVISISEIGGGDLETSFDRSMAMGFITLYDEEAGIIMCPSLSKPDESDSRTCQNWVFPAHVFGSSGAIALDDVQRIPLRIGLRPDASPEDRFVIDVATGERRDNAVVVSLYTALGRVKMNT